MIGDLLAHGVGRAGRPTRASLIRFDDGDNLGGINPGVGSTDPVKGVSDGDGLAMRRQRKDEDIAEFPDARWVMAVNLDHDLLGQLQVGRAVADGRCEVDASVVRDVAGFDKGKIDLTEESLEKLLRAVREMNVREFDSPVVDGIPTGFLALVRHPKADCVRLRKVHVDRGPALGTTEDPNPERLAALVKSPSALSERPRHGFRTTGVGESTNAQGCAVGNQPGCFLGRSDGKSPV